MLHEKPRPIYIRAVMSQWVQKLFEVGCIFFTFEIFKRFTLDFPNHRPLFNNYSFE